MTQSSDFCENKVASKDVQINLQYFLYFRILKFLGPIFRLIFLRLKICLTSPVWSFWCCPSQPVLRPTHMVQLPRELQQRLLGAEHRQGALAIANHHSSRLSMGFGGVCATSPAQIRQNKKVPVFFYDSFQASHQPQNHSHILSKGVYTPRLQ